jgi:tetratricopeptide (TPR) repeat protein
MTASPAKTKAFLATMKEQYLDNTPSPCPLEGLLKMELVLRGIMVQDDTKLWKQVYNGIGKALLEESSFLPKPLLAGATVMAGRVAEACPPASGATQTQSQSQSVVEQDHDKASVLQRAKELQDERWMILLQDNDVNDRNHNDPPFLEIAQGYYTRAALIQKETPPMWKKVWDLWTLRSEDQADPAPFEAQTAIEQLIRIVAAKGINHKRVAELQLVLISSYLNPVRIIATGGASANVSQAFGDSLTSKLPTDPTVLAELAKKTLDDLESSCSLVEQLTDADTNTLYQVMKVRVGMALETSTIETMALAQHQGDKNRSVSTSLEDCRSKSRQLVFAQTEEDTLPRAGIALRDTVVKTWASTCSSSEETKDAHWGPCLEWIQLYLMRLRDRAQARTKKGDNESWSTVLTFILPLLETMQERLDWNLKVPRTTRVEQISTWLSSCPTHERSLVSLLALTLPTVYWMTLALTTTTATIEEDEPLDQTLKFVLDLLSVLIQQGVSKEAKAKAASSAAVGSKTNESSQSRRWKVARAIAICGIGQDHDAIIGQVTREAIATKRQDQGALGILQCLVAWSGWHQRPWPYCSNISDVRRLLTATRVNTAGRSLTALEEDLLDLAHADAELLNGGFPDEAGRRYSQVLQRLENNTNDDSCCLEGIHLSLMQAHCHNGLAKVVQMGVAVPDSKSGEDLAQTSLGLLEDLEIPQSVRPLHIWHARSVFTAALSHQRSVARQLIADSLVHEGRCEEARAFLEAAVQEAPLDADTALALGAFLLRMAFYVNPERSDEANKAAQIQLLKAAKLDASKANPFALLGLWFEEQGDLQRAQGCYAKSLGLDSCNPVAGRGLLRLESRETIQKYLGTAIDSNSPLTGWAWRAVGLNKVFVDGEDEFAVVALLKSLRCRDVALASSESLGIFYQRRSEDYVNERADALGEVAMCYRRLGRFTASIRAFYAGIEAAGENVSSSVLCSCAQGK